MIVVGGHGNDNQKIQPHQHRGYHIPIWLQKRRTGKAGCSHKEKAGGCRTEKTPGELQHCGNIVKKAVRHKRPARKIARRQKNKYAAKHKKVKRIAVRPAYPSPLFTQKINDTDPHTAQKGKSQ